MALRCVSSQWTITVSPDSFVHQYDVDIVFGRPETINDENGRGVKKLSKSNNAISKSICRQIVQGLPELNGIIYVYNDRAILLTNKPLKDDIKVTISQSNLDESLRKILISRESVLKIAITKTKTIKLSDFPIDAASTLKEDRTWRTLIEMIISEDAVTRVNDKYIPIDGAICENKFTNFCCGLIYRNGVKKGVEVIELDNRPQLALTMDYCCKFLYPGGIIFLDLIKRFMSENGTYKDAEAFFKNIKLCPTYDRSRILIFYKFTEKSMRFLKTQNGGTLEEYYRSWNIRLRYLDEPAAITNGYGDFPLELLEVLANQSVSIGKMPGGSISRKRSRP
uniref:Uncharacterized protein n=1 Tax=Panagrolaimus superbus TaxID=310955 RepID=A0A914Y5Q6_9BILA